jgi:hypothetical protein
MSDSQEQNNNEPEDKNPNQSTEEENKEKEENTSEENPKDNLFQDFNEIKGELENLMGNVISFCPIEIIDANKEKLEMKHNEKEMYNNFYKKYITNFQKPNDLTDEYRPPFANNYYGGVDFPNAETTSLIRGMGWDLIKQIGRKILNGDFNFTTVSIPIKVMVPISILQHICNGHFNYPLYMNLAYESNNSLEQMKYTIVACISSWYKSNVFLKPLNPILGETYEMIWEDGSHEYVEQTSHHPPRSHFLIIGNENKWRYYGYFDYTSNGWFNSFKLTNSGSRIAEFNNTKSKIHFDYPVDNFGNTFWGTMRQESLGNVTFKDLTHGYEAVMKFGIEGKLSDYFEGTIEKDDEVLSNVKGSYLEYIEIDGERFWDIRRNINIQSYPIKNQIKSSSIYRPDSLKLLEKDIEGAQEKKDEQENLQRHDRKLRKEWEEKEKNNE